MAEFKEIDDINFPFEVGALPDRNMALRFADFLNSKGIRAAVKRGFGSSFSVYVAEEKHVSAAKLELLRFGNNPFAGAYNQASWNRAQTVKRERVIRNGLWANFSLVSFTTFTELICIVIYLASLLGFERSLTAALSWTSLSQITEDFQIYRVFTPVFLHFGILHIAFNLVMFEAFCRPLENFCGLAKVLCLTFGIALVSNFLQLLFLSEFTVFGGMSGVVYGLIGYMGIMSKRSDLPQAMRLPQGLLLVSFIFIGLGFFMSGIANLCHLGGLLIGLAVGFIDLNRPLSKVCRNMRSARR